MAEKKTKKTIAETPKVEVESKPNRASIGEFSLANPAKVERALNGDMMNDGSYRGGVIKDGKYDSMELLVEYDRIGGYIKDEEGNKVKTGSFYDFKAKQAHKTPQIVRIFTINGEFIEVAEGNQTPRIVEAQKEYNKAKEILAEDKKKEKAKPRQISKIIKV